MLGIKLSTEIMFLLIKELASYNDLSLGDTIKLEDEDNNTYLI